MHVNACNVDSATLDTDMGIYAFTPDLEDMISCLWSASEHVQSDLHPGHVTYFTHRLFRTSYTFAYLAFSDAKRRL